MDLSGHVLIGMRWRQPLHTHRKLFCHCRTPKVLSTHGTTHMLHTDAASGDSIQYQFHPAHVCAYELGAAPPFAIDPQAVEHATQIAQRLGCQIAPSCSFFAETQITNAPPSGKIHGTRLAQHGTIPTPTKEIVISNVFLKESRCTLIQRPFSEKVSHLRLEHTGRPQIVLQLPRQFNSIEEALTAAQHIQDMLGALGHNTAYHAPDIDVELSYQHGTFVTLTHIHALSQLRRALQHEAQRQAHAQTLRASFRREQQDFFPTPPHPIDEYALPATLNRHLHKLPAKNAHSQWYLFQLPELRSQPTSLTQAVMASFARILRAHVSTEQRRALHILTDPTSLAWRLDAQDKDQQRALEALMQQAFQLTEGVSQTHRYTLPNGHTLPLQTQPQHSDQRAPYIAPIHPIEHQHTELPIAGWQWRRNWQTLGMSTDIIDGLIALGFVELFEELRALSKKLPFDHLGEILVRWYRALKRQGLPVHQLTKQRLFSIVSFYAMGRCHREAIKDLMAFSCLYPERSVRELLQHEMGIQVMSVKDLRRALPVWIQHTPPPKTTIWAKRERYWMGVVMERVRGAISGADAHDVLIEYLSAQPPTPLDKAEYPPPHKKNKVKN